MPGIWCGKEWGKGLGIGCALAAALLLGGVAQAENAEDEEPGRERGRHERLLERFDTDGDGELSEAERSSARESRRLKRLEKYDRDGDGRLSDRERATARKAHRQQRLERFDADGDGELSREERRAAFESGADCRGRHRRGERDGHD